MALPRLRIFAGATFLLVLVAGFIFLYAYSLQDSSIVFPQNSALWNKYYTFYGITLALTLIAISVYNRSTLRKLATADYWNAMLTRFIPKAIFYFILFGVVFTVANILKGEHAVNIFKTLAYIPIGVIITHTFVTTQIEELLFGGLIYGAVEEKRGKKTADLVTLILFPLFHLVKTGGNIILMVAYIPLRYLWNYERNYGTPILNRIAPKFFGGSPQTQQANAGSHFAWNLFVIGVTPGGI